MKKQTSNSAKTDFSGLRKKAEKMLPEMEISEIPVNSIADAQRLITELQVHQIELELQNDELRQMQEQLTIEREKYADLYNFAPVAYFTFDEQDVILDLNLAAAELLGNERKFLLGHPLSPYITPDSLQTFIRHRQSTLETKTTQVCELTIRLRDGRIAYVHARTAALEAEPGEMRRWRSVMTDITTRKKQEENARYQAYLLENVFDAIIATDNKLRITKWNRVAEQLYGWSEAEVIGRVIDEVCQTEFLPNAQAQARDQLASQKFWRGELRQRRRNGGELWVIASVSRLEDAYGNSTGGVTINHDVTERKLSEEKLRESEARHRRLVEGAPAIVYTFSNKRGGIYYSPVVGEVLGYSPEYLYAHPFLWQESIHPEDVAVMEQAVRQAEAGSPYNIEYRIRDVHEKWRWFSDLSVGCSFESGEAIIEGLATDITERKKMAEELQASHQHLEATLDALPDLMFEVDRDGKVYDYHASRPGLLDIPPHQFIGRDPEKFLPGDAIQVVKSALEQAAKNGTSFGSIYPISTANGIIWYELSVAVVGDPGSYNARFIVLARDITERKKIEDDLKQANDRLHLQVKQNESLHNQLRDQALRDPLTGLFNRRYLQETLDREVSRAHREGKPIGFIIMDVDHFKRVNDTYGHKTGDMLLQKLGGLILRNLRSEDIPCRYGGEEFTIIMPGASLDATVHRAGLLLEQMKEMDVLYDGVNLQITASMGVATFPEHGTSGEEVLIRADRALYHAKKSGRSQVVVYQDDFNATV